MTPPVGMAPKRNIAFVVRNLSLGGIPRVVIELCDAWATQHPEHKVNIVLLDDHGRHYDTPDDVSEHDLTHLLNDLPAKLVRAGNRVFPNLFSILTMGRNTRALNRWAWHLETDSGAPVDIVLCGYGAISSFWPGKVRNGICVAHNLYSAMLAERTGRLAPLNRRLLRRTLRDVPVYGISTPIRDSLRNDIKVKTEDLVLYNPIDVQRIRRLSQESPVTEIPKPYILYLGRLSPEKNVDVIIRAFGQMKTKAAPVLAIAGAGSEGPRLEKLAAQQPRPVVFLGSVKNPYVPLAQATGLVLASDFEGMPTVLLEARALGIPIITTPAGGASIEAIEGYERSTVVSKVDSDLLSVAFSHIFEYPLSDVPTSMDDLVRFSTLTSIQRYQEALHVRTK